MDSGFVLLALLLLFVVFVLPIWAMISATGAKSRMEQTAREMESLRARQARMEQRLAALESGGPVETRALLRPVHAAPVPPPPPVPVKDIPPVPPDPIRIPAGVSRGIPQPAAPLPTSAQDWLTGALEQIGLPQLAPTPPPRPAVPPGRTTLPAGGFDRAALEQFMGAKLFAWVGGLALFLGVLFFVKLSIERGWLPPGLRVAIGFVTGLGLLAGGWSIQRRKPYAVLAHTLCATGIVVLYGVSYAAHALYGIPPFDHALVTFAAMSLITAAAFGLAGRMKAQVIAVLGMLGGFLTPILCSTGQDNPFGLFSYIALLDLGVLAVAHRQRWLHLTPLAALGTVLMQIGWMGTFFKSSGYAVGGATWIPVAVFLGFALLFLLASLRTSEDEPDQSHGVVAAVLMAGSAMVAGFGFMGIDSIAQRPAVLYTLVLGINGLLMALAWGKPATFRLYAIFSGITLVHLMLWTMLVLTESLLPWALALYLIFGVAHTGFVMGWRKRGGAAPDGFGWLPVVSPGLMLLPVLLLDRAGPLLWAALLPANGLVMALAFRTGAAKPVFGALILTLLTAGIWFFRLPLDLDGASGSLAPFLTVTGGFAGLFAAAGTLLARRAPQDDSARWLPAAAAVLPFILLILTVIKLPLPNPSPVFGLAGILAVFMLGLALFAGQRELAPAALGSVVVLVWAWYGRMVDDPGQEAGTALTWYLSFYALFQVFPWVFRRVFEKETLPWMTAALAGVGFFPPVYGMARQGWFEIPMGWLPAAFAVLPLAGLAYIGKRHTADNPARLNQLAWLGGIGLLFITLIFPVQFERQWLTLGWALEGAALCWLFRRVPHPGLRGTGAVLLGVAFVRLALNPRSYTGPLPPVPMLNWQLYAFTVTVLALFAAAAWLKPPHHLWGRYNLKGVFHAMAGILLFMLLNIEIASAFTPVGQELSLQSPGTDFARAMTATISWSLFALGLLILGFWKRHALTRYAGIALLVAALLKLFLHDLARTGSVYRIGAFVVVALIALAASWLYQRFLTPPEPPGPGPGAAGQGEAPPNGQ